MFDLSLNKHEPICEQKILKRWKLTKITFNTKNPIVLCGDERGSVIALKLSPNLRKDWKQVVVVLRYPKVKLRVRLRDLIMY